MSETSPYAAPLSFADRISVVAAFVLVGSLFYTVGWMVIRPIDPLGAVTLLDNGSAVLSVVKLACLAAIGSALATVLLRAHVADFGLMAAAVGLAAMNTRGATVDFLVRFLPEGATRSSVLFDLAVETLGWLIVVLVAAMVGELVARWFVAGGSASYSQAHVGLGHLLTGRVGSRPDKAELRNGPLCLLICVVVAALVIRLTGGTVLMAIRTGQTYFSILAGFFVATLLAHQITRAKLAVWPMLAVPIVAILGYLAGVAKPIASVPEVYQKIDHIMPNFVCRALPVEYVALGVIGVIAGLWTSARMLDAQQQSHG